VVGGRGVDTLRSPTMVIFGGLMRKLLLIVLLLIPIALSSCHGDRLRGLPPGSSGK